MTWGHSDVPGFSSFYKLGIQNVNGLNGDFHNVLDYHNVILRL